MSNDATWQRFFTSTDLAGLEELKTAARQTIDSLSSIGDAPRSSLLPAELQAAVRDLEVCPEEGFSLAQVLDEFGSVVWANGVVPGDSRCVAHLHPPTLLPSVVTELAIAATNQSMDSWDQAPVATEVELHLMSWLAVTLGFGASGTGIMTSGGTASNVLGMTLARAAAANRLGVDVGKSGLPPEARTWRILCSNQAHFSIQRAAAQLGLGREAVVTVATTPSGAMDLDALDQALEQLVRDGLEPIAIVGTAGTTDLGVIDPLLGIAERAERHGSWFHIDAAVAGSFILSNTLASRLTGIERADSVTIDFHKLWWQPFNASALVVSSEDVFDLLRVRSAYLDRGDELEGMVNLVGRSLDTSRRFDAAKVMTSLRTVGRSNLAAMVERCVALASYAGECIEGTSGLELVATPTSVMCVFDAPGHSADDLRRVQQHLLASGEMVLGRTEIHGRAALKFTFMNPSTSEAQIDGLVEKILKTLLVLSD